jgi:hypothetical protein
MTVLPFPEPRAPSAVDRIACSTCRQKTFLVERPRPGDDWAVVCPVCQNQIAATFSLLEGENPAPG